MTDEEWIKTIPSLTNKELLDKLDYCGYDNYYSKIREPVVAEIARRLKENERLKKDSEENQDLATIAYMQGASKYKAKLDKAEEIIKDFYESVKGNGTTCVNAGTRFINVLELVKKAEVFLKEVKE